MLCAMSADNNLFEKALGVHFKEESYAQNKKYAEKISEARVEGGESPKHPGLSPTI